ncbi:hypothetical protein FACS1894166_12550 [Bacilli bacterium]|nr:hypothetical protein FACS1894166_12550 [Bacilli bacterium]
MKKIPTANEFQLIETAMNLQSGVMDHSEEGKQNTQLVRPEFRRIDSFIFYVTYAFLHILDDILERTRLQESNFLIEESFNIDTLASAEESE